jgi:peptidoglycan-associated lipoprotein
MLYKQVKCSGMLVLLLGVTLMGAGCRNNDAPILDPVINDPSNTNTASRPGGSGGANPNELPDLGSDILFSPDRGLEKIYFDYNSFALRSDALAALDRNAAKLRQYPNTVVQIEGHCDERGTQEYNLALGEKRALATREHLIKLGIPADRIITISYGEEMPAVQGSGESVWSQNRRCEFNRAM